MHVIIYLRLLLGASKYEASATEVSLTFFLPGQEQP